MSIHVNYNDIAACRTVYRGEHYCGHVFCRTAGGSGDYLASPWTDAVPQKSFSTEAEAIAYLAEAA